MFPDVHVNHPVQDVRFGGSEPQSARRIRLSGRRPAYHGDSVHLSDQGPS